MGDLSELILGSWQMVSWTYETLETGEVCDALGPNPRGYINYGADGRMMVLVLNEDRKSPAALVPTSEEKIALYDTMFAYAGTYTVEGDRVVHHLDMSWNKAWEGTRQVRTITVDGETLNYLSEPAGKSSRRKTLRPHGQVHKSLLRIKGSVDAMTSIWLEKYAAPCRRIGQEGRRGLSNLLLRTQVVHIASCCNPGELRICAF